ncbi:MAG: D-alanyl-D-alanine carboxypeptidase family protein [Mahellales bacterium]|jgi:D-alanyl-D-alanine carboxypeptidase (penicillin-binding protein 5/6)
MKKILMSSIIVFIIIIYAGIPRYHVRANAQQPQTISRAAIVIEADTNRILYEKNIHQRLANASTTKILTAIIAIEHGNLSDMVRASDKASKTGGSSIWLEEGEILSMKEMLYGLMLNSGNDAAVAIAEHISGSVEEFAVLMNKKAREIGALDSNFVNPHGLPDDNHYTTAYDLALIASYAMKNPIFREIVSTKEKRISWPEHEWDRILVNKNKLLSQYQGANGIKTGYTKKAGRCLVAAAQRNGMQLISVVLNCQPMFEESMALLDHTFDKFKPKHIIKKGQILKEVKVEKGEENNVQLLADKDIILPLAQGEINHVKVIIDYPKYISAPVRRGQQCGTINIKLYDKDIASCTLVAQRDIKEKSFVKSIRDLLNQWFNKKYVPEVNG